ncbi:hypothetical protein U9M48_041824, partial [Paspalum notatum var. saurae]
MCLLHEAIAIAVECLDTDFQQRPEMSDVLSRVQIIAAAQSIRSKLTVGGNNEPSQLTAPTPVNHTAKTLLTTVSNISMEELETITRNFSRDFFIGEGTYGRVFLVVLKDGHQIAVKKLYQSKEILVQVATVSGMHKHENVVQLLRYFIEGERRVLAYEYSARGSLHDILH